MVPEAENQNGDAPDTGAPSASIAEGAAVITHHLKTLPASPGVYRMIAADGAVLYVGKAKDLKKRVAAYTAPERQSIRIRRMIALTADMEFMTTSTEAEALCRALTGDNAEHVVSYGTEAGLFQNGGYSACICGPGNIEQAHQPDEFIEISQLRAGEAFMDRLIDRLASHVLDNGTEHFDASTLAATTIDTGNPANNVIPAHCRATVNIRFNDTHTGASITEWLDAETRWIETEFGVKVDMKIKVSGEAFLTPPGALSALVAGARSRQNWKRGLDAAIIKQQYQEAKGKVRLEIRLQ